MDVLAQAGGLDLFGQVVIAVVLSGIAYLTGNRVRKQDSGWERLVQVNQTQISRMQRTIDTLDGRNQRLEEALAEALHEAAVCPHPHLSVERHTEG